MNTMADCGARGVFGSVQPLALQRKEVPTSKSIAVQGVAGVVAVLTEFHDDTTALSQAARALKDLTRGGGGWGGGYGRRDGVGGGGVGGSNIDASDAARLEAGRTGACAALVAAMEQHGGHGGFQRRALQALANVAFGSDANRALIGTAGGCAAVTEALKRHGPFSADIVS